ncbi:type VI secretion system contractile sheath small subunit [Pseudomonas fluorescens]|uniref:type VI secretion system contractile sheath small subunit n=1 Tax=Pseudomonas fluorescens TaxID=294 RepID=UPI001116AA5C|nr:type VI secretion system contractile sheath small subunit [Pseudomonas fluorescens]
MREDLIGIPGPTLYRLMALRNALVALKGPLANDPALCESVRKHLFEDKGVDPVNKACTGIEREPPV